METFLFPAWIWEAQFPRNFISMENTEQLLKIYNTPDHYMFSMKSNYVEINNNGDIYEVKTKFTDKVKN